MYSYCQSVSQIEFPAQIWRAFTILQSFSWAWGWPCGHSHQRTSREALSYAHTHTYTKAAE